MSRPAASDVSALSGFVANGRQAVHHVSSPPSEIPYGGFSPVRLQTGAPDATFAAVARGGSLIRARSSPGPLVPVGPPTAWRRAGYRRAADPEALGSPAGYAVPLGLCLLWPHEPLSVSPPSLSVSSRRVFVLRSDRDGYREVPQFTPRVFLTVPSSVPRQSNGAPTVSSPSALAFTFSVEARHLQILPRRFSMGRLCSRGCNIRFMLRPGELLALHRQELLLSSFRFSGSPPRSVEYNYPAKQSIAGARLSLARHAALWAANREHRGIKAENENYKPL